MNSFISLCRIIVQFLSGPGPEVHGNRAFSQDLSGPERFLLIGLRSPGDQLQVVAIKPSYSDELGQSDHPPPSN
jgi:hypothetical protein